VIALALVMMRVRAAHAATVCLLAALAIGASVAAPLYVLTAQRSVTRVDLDTASPNELTILSSYDLIHRSDPNDERSQQRAAADRNKEFDSKGTAALTIPGFNRVYTVGFDISMDSRQLPPVADPENAPVLPKHWLEYRDGVCQHVRLDAGRCPGADGEVIVGPAAAKAYQLQPGSLLYLQNMTYHPPAPQDPGGGFWAPSGDQAVVSVVGVYHGLDPTDVYFTGRVSLSRGGDEPVYTSRHTIATIDHVTETQRVLAYPGPAALDPDTFAAITPQVQHALAAIRLVNTQPQTSIATLLAKVATDRAEVSVLPGVLELPLLVLCCFVVFLAAANTAQARRIELGMLKLRGSTWSDRLWLASAEIVLPLLAGGVVGYLLGHVAVWLLARVTLTVSPAFAVTTQFVPQAALALLGVVVAGLIGLRRDLVTPVSELLRRVPSRGGRWGSVVLRTVVIVLAVAAVVQVRTGGPELAGLATLAPAIIILALGLVLALTFDPLVGRWGRRAVRRGRVGPAMAMLHLSRRRSGSRVVALLAIAVGLVGYVAIAYGTGTGARHDQVVASLGARRVVTVPELSMRELLTDVRAADPDGRYAMAVMPASVGGPNSPEILAVDSPRLGTAASWPAQGSGGLTVDAAMRALRPRVASSVDIRGTGLTLTAGMTPAVAKSRVNLAAVLAPLDGAPAQYVRFKATAAGSDTYQAAVKCPAGCRLSALVIADYSLFDLPPGTLPDYRAATRPVTVTFSQLAQTGPAAQLVGPADFNGWQDRQAAELTLAPGPAGAAVTVGAATTQASGPAAIGPPDLPETLPAVSPSSMVSPPASVQVPSAVVDVNAQPQSPLSNPITGMRPVATATVLPRVGSTGVLVDLEYLVRLGEPGLTRTGGEVWLGPAAPPDALDRLKAAGLTVLTVRDFDTEYANAGGGPNAVGLQFLLAVGVLCLALGAGGLVVAGTVELRARADELRSLRRQGASRWAVARAGRQSYLVMVGAGTAFGAVAAAVAWWLTRDRLPVVDVLVAGVPVPTWPGLTPVWAWLAATAGLVLVALLLSTRLSSAIRTGARTRRSTNTEGRGR
jgi:putative ABC transport system permease protein